MIRTYREIANTWYYLAHSINLLLDIRKDFEKNADTHRSDIRTINLQLILNSPALIEGSISSVLIQHISQGENYKRANRENNDELRKILDNLIDNINKSQWKDLSQNTIRITEIDLKKIFEGNWEIVISHFKFRNLLAHGGIIITGIDLKSDTNNIKEIENEERIDLHNYDSLFNFLVKYKLIEEKNKLIDWEFLKSEIADFFLKYAITLIKNFYKTYTEKYPANRFIKDNLKEINKLT